MRSLLGLGGNRYTNNNHMVKIREDCGYKFINDTEQMGE